MKFCKPEEDATLEIAASLDVQANFSLTQEETTNKELPLNVIDFIAKFPYHGSNDIY